MVTNDTDFKTRIDIDKMLYVVFIDYLVSIQITGVSI